MEIGTKLGTFEITGLLGKGGMGEVYRATDSKLGREVAIKVLPDVFAIDAERLARFEREAQTLASLNHPNVATVYGFEHDADAGVHYLIMEHIDGETLGERIEAGALSVSDSLPLFIDIARGLDAAHEAGIIHRDMKPDNVKVNADGVVKILDFGIAKNTLVSKDTDPDAATTPMSPIAVTAEGTFMGTPMYMSPEQARGKAVDKRTDIWAFGCCLYEALTGDIPFKGDTVADTVGAILEREPDWDKLPEDLPQTIRELIQQCLQKNIRQRIRDIGDLCRTLEKCSSDSGNYKVVPDQTHAPRLSSSNNSLLSFAIPLIIGGLISVAATWFFMNNKEIVDPTNMENAIPPPLLKRFTVDVGVTQPRGFLPKEIDFTISPDGTRFAYAAKQNDATRIYTRTIDNLDLKVIEDSVDGSTPFFSPNSRYLAYTALDEGELVLMKKPVDKDKAQVLCKVNNPSQGTWLKNGTIVFSDVTLNTPQTTRLYKVSDQGGTPEIIEAINSKDHQLAFIEPSALPERNALLYTMFDSENPSVGWIDLDTNSFETLIPGGRAATYASSGHIVFSKNEGLWVVPFDPESGSIIGQEVQIHPENDLKVLWYNKPYALAAEGAFIFLPAPITKAEQRILAWVSRDGVEETLPLRRAPYFGPRLSPNGKYVATGLADPENEDLWIHELDRPNSLMRLTFDEGIDRGGIWTPDSKNIIFVSNRDDEWDLYKRPADGTGSITRILERPFVQAPGAIDSLGKEIVFTELANGWDIGILPLQENDSPTILIGTEDSNASNPDLSPNDQFIVYESNETDQPEIYVRPYPNVNDGKWQVSSDGGVEPMWSHTGDEIFYRQEGKMMSVEVSTTETLFRFETPTILFDGDYFTDKFGAREYDLEYSDNRRFLMVKELAPNDTTQLIYISNWTQQLKDLAPPDQKE